MEGDAVHAANDGLTLDRYWHTSLKSTTSHYFRYAMFNNVCVVPNINVHFISFIDSNIFLEKQALYFPQVNNDIIFDAASEVLTFPFQFGDENVCLPLDKNAHRPFSKRRGWIKYALNVIGYRIFKC